MTDTVRQACPECENGESLAGVATVIRMAPFAECWRCDGYGLVEPYNDSKSRIVVHHG